MCLWLLLPLSIISYLYASFLVPTKSTNGQKKWRMVVDFKRLNEKVIPDKYPLPRIDTFLDSLGSAKFFSILDLYGGFYQVKLNEKSRYLTAFCTERGIFQWKVLPFGLKISPNSFCRMMQTAFAGLGPDRAFIYMDDIIVIGKTEDHHLENLKRVFAF